ncbi:MAG: TatD family hydrolase [Candidatus Cloacimonetes bacterium]|nr:TatD family hydrolase [Candidatus Cloacimonadota bacterium]
MKIFETHAHLDFKDYNSDRDQIISECFRQGIEYIVNVGVDKETSIASVKLAEKYENIYATVGYHPHDAEDFDESVILPLLKDKKVVAIGEIGLDFYRNISPKQTQIDVFRKQIEIAVKNRLPIVIHDRDAHEETFSILNEYNPVKVVFHCFSGDINFAKRVIEKGWNISFTGTVTYKNSLLDAVIRYVPKEQFFVETDSPYLAPVPFRGKRNNPAMLRYIIEKISEIRMVPPKLIADQSFQNAVQFFLTNNK